MNIFFFCSNKSYFFHLRPFSSFFAITYDVKCKKRGEGWGLVFIFLADLKTKLDIMSSPLLTYPSLILSSTSILSHPSFTHLSSTVKVTVAIISMRQPTGTCSRMASSCKCPTNKMEQQMITRRKWVYSNGNLFTGNSKKLVPKREQFLSQAHSRISHREQQITEEWLQGSMQSTHQLSPPEYCRLFA